MNYTTNSIFRLKRELEDERHSADDEVDPGKEKFYISCLKGSFSKNYKTEECVVLIHL